MIGQYVHVYLLDYINTNPNINPNINKCESRMVVKHPTVVEHVRHQQLGIHVHVFFFPFTREKELCRSIIQAHVSCTWTTHVLHVGRRLS